MKKWINLYVPLIFICGWWAGISYTERMYFGMATFIVLGGIGLALLIGELEKHPSPTVIGEQQ